MNDYFIKLPSNNADLNGILYNLYYQNPTNYFSLVSIDGSKVNDDGWSEKEVLINPSITGTSIKDAWCSFNEPYANISIHFSKHFLTLTNYTLKTRTTTANDFPTGWILYGSLDNKTWTMIDEKADVKELNQLNLAKTYSVKQIGTYKHFRFIQTSNSDNRYVFGLSKVEFFGKFTEKYRIHQTCEKRRNEMIKLNLFLVIWI